MVVAYSMPFMDEPGVVVVGIVGAGVVVFVVVGDGVVVFVVVGDGVGWTAGSRLTGSLSR